MRPVSKALRNLFPTAGVFATAGWASCYAQVDLAKEMPMSKDEEHVWPAAIPVDATIRELRHYFRLLEIKQIKSEIDDRIRLARAAESEARQATKEAKRARKAAKKKLSFKKAPPLPEIKLMRHCFRCGADMPDLDPSALPKPCRKCDEAERSYVGPVKPRTVTAFLEIDVFKGGAPGSGKRR